MTAYTTAYKPLRIGRVRISQEALFDWLDLSGAVLIDARKSADSPSAVLDLYIKHHDMPDCHIDGSIDDVMLVHSIVYHEYHDKPVRTGPKRED